MLRLGFFVFLLLAIFTVSAQVTYTLIYKDSSCANVKVSIRTATPVSSASFCLVMPRSIPGAYGISMYDNFILHPVAISDKAERITMTKDYDGAPRWYCDDTTRQISSVEYDVDLNRMDREMQPSDASVIRPGFAGILNYTIFGWIKGTEKQAVQCDIETFDQWPVFFTQSPSVTLQKGSVKFNTDNYYSLADGQIFLGPAFRIKQYSGIVPLFIVSYSQCGTEYLDDYGLQGMMSMGIIRDYFGELPFKQYTILLRHTIPPLPGSYGAFGMEHLQSSTFFGDTSDVRKKPLSKERIVKTMATYLHHMAHALIPLRCYGDTYRPYPQEIPPIINNIWFNEGFMWFLPFDTLKLTGMQNMFHYYTFSGSKDIRKMTLAQLSQSASTMYATDFRLGMAVYSRGALMAQDIDHYLKTQTNGKKSMKDVFRYLYQWTKQNQRAFTMEEFPLLLNNACGMDVSTIYNKWQHAIE